MMDTPISFTGPLNVVRTLLSKLVRMSNIE